MYVSRDKGTFLSPTTLEIREREDRATQLPRFVWKFPLYPRGSLIRKLPVVSGREGRGSAVRIPLKVTRLSSGKTTATIFTCEVYYLESGPAYMKLGGKAAPRISIRSIAWL